jgi:hypothetical protein
MKVTPLLAFVCKVNYPAYKAGHLGKAMRGIASPLPPLRIHPRPQDGVFCGIFIIILFGI